jgi:hypothetical protein
MRTSDRRALLWLDDLGRDLRYAGRGLRRNPIFAFVAVLTLALGARANISIFSLADAVLFRMLPVRHPRDLIVLHQRNQTRDTYPFTTAASTNLSASRDVLAGIAAFRPVPGMHVALAQTPPLLPGHRSIASASA